MNSKAGVHLQHMLCDPSYHERQPNSCRINRHKRCVLNIDTAVAIVREQNNCCLVPSSQRDAADQTNPYMSNYTQHACKQPTNAHKEVQPGYLPNPVAILKSYVSAAQLCQIPNFH